jgi:hypothetical protein
MVILCWGEQIPDMAVPRLAAPEVIELNMRCFMGKSVGQFFQTALPDIVRHQVDGIAIQSQGMQPFGA